MCPKTIIYKVVGDFDDDLVDFSRILFIEDFKILIWQFDIEIKT
jgi:hypothetical protein